MPITVNYFYSIQLVGEDGERTTKPCGPYQLSAYDFSAVNQTALCFAPPGTQLAYAHKLTDSRGYPTGVVVSAEHKVDEQNGEWMTIPVNRLKP